MKKVILSVGLVAILLSGCAAFESHNTQEKAMASESLYDRLGQRAAIILVVDEFTALMAADKRVNGDFAKTDIAKFKSLLVDQICAATGGPCQYGGRNMVETHKGMNITEEQFNISGGYLDNALDKYNVPQKEKTELLTAIGGMAPDIIGK